MKDQSENQWELSIERLRYAVNRSFLTQSQISEATGVHQSQVSRILAGNVKRASKNVLLLCKYANDYSHSGTADPAKSPVLMDALKTVWDGSPSHAQAIASVILSLQYMRG